MTPALRDTTLSTTILDVIKVVLPFTASGSAMPAGTAQDVVIKLSAAQKLATLVEQELAIHRFDEAGYSNRALAREAATAIEQTVTSTVIQVDFDGGRKK